MSKNVVYILGAGFSAPLGIPVMRNFIDTARRLRRDHKEFEYFNEVIDLVQKTVSSEKFFSHDSMNIEQALSLLEMKDTVEKHEESSLLEKFILDVIKATTPQIESLLLWANREVKISNLFTNDKLWQGYCAFVASLHHLEMQVASRHGTNGIRASKLQSDINYSVISLNYDMVLEDVCKFMQESFWSESLGKIEFAKSSVDRNAASGPPLIKLHGSLDTGKIIPPTFIKTLHGNQLPDSWRQAYDVLTTAHDIRVVGYSLPESDSYIKYLLMAAIDKLKDLDNIDWIALDRSGEMEKRFDAFVRFNHKRFSRGDSSAYLQSIFEYTIQRPHPPGPHVFTFRDLEDAHEFFMGHRLSNTP